MKALRWHGKGDIRRDTVPGTTIGDARDVIIRVVGCAMRGADLRLTDGQMPTTESGDVLDHESMAGIAETGSPDRTWKKGDRIAAPFNTFLDIKDDCVKVVLTLA